MTLMRRFMASPTKPLNVKAMFRRIAEMVMSNQMHRPTAPIAAVRSSEIAIAKSGLHRIPRFDQFRMLFTDFCSMLPGQPIAPARFLEPFLRGLIALRFTVAGITGRCQGAVIGFVPSGLTLGARLVPSQCRRSRSSTLFVGEPFLVRWHHTDYIGAVS